MINFLSRNLKIRLSGLIQTNQTNIRGEKKQKNKSQFFGMFALMCFHTITPNTQFFTHIITKGTMLSS